MFFMLFTSNKRSEKKIFAIEISIDDYLFFFKNISNIFTTFTLLIKTF